MHTDRSLKNANKQRISCINMHDMNDFLYFCGGIWLIYDRYYRTEGLVPQEIVYFVFIVHSAVVWVNCDAAEVQGW